jgi:hypothetical protein
MQEKPKAVTSSLHPAEEIKRKVSSVGKSYSSIVQATLATGSTSGAGSEAVSLLKVAGVSASGEWLECWCRCCCGDAPDSEICFSVVSKVSLRFIEFLC